MLLARRITVIIQGRKCSQTKKMIENYITGKGGRYCRGSMKLNCVKGSGQRYLWFDVLLVAKRKHRLYSIKKDYRTGALTLDAASKPIFPLIILFAHPKGISKLRGNETYIRNLYRLRWQIEIAFREMNKLGFSFRLQGRDARLSIQGAKSLLYNIWHVQRHFLQKRDPNERDLQLDGFLGKTYRRRHVEYILLNDAILQGMPLVIKLN